MLAIKEKLNKILLPEDIYLFNEKLTEHLLSAKVCASKKKREQEVQEGEIVISMRKIKAGFRDKTTFEESCQA